MKCLLDLDGIIADFHQQWHTMMGIPYPNPWPAGVWSIAQVHGISWKDSCRGLNVNFWNSIPWMPDGREILTLLEEKFGKENICILTSNHVDDAATAAYGKVQWIERELPDYSHRYFLGAAKDFLAHPGVCLIDDKNENIANFCGAGGEGFLVPRPWNMKHFIADKAVFYLKDYLRFL